MCIQWNIFKRDILGTTKDDKGSQDTGDLNE